MPKKQQKTQENTLPLPSIVISELEDSPNSAIRENILEEVNWKIFHSPEVLEKFKITPGYMAKAVRPAIYEKDNYFVRLWKTFTPTWIFKILYNRSQRCN